MIFSRIPHVFFAICLFFPALSTQAAEKKGVTFQDQLTEKGHALVLNGIGVRKAFGVVTVYLGGLYLEKKSHDANEILASKEWKKIILHFVMDVEKDKITEAWLEGLKKNCHKDCDSFSTDMKTLNGWMTNMKNKEEIMFAFGPETLTVTVNGKEKGTITKAMFPQQVLAIFIGEQPPNKALRNGMLEIE